MSAKYDKANSVINGTPTVINPTYYSISDPIISTEPATKNYVDTNLGSYLKKDGSVAMTGALNLGINKITGVVDPVIAQDAATKNYVDTNNTSQYYLIPLTNTGFYAYFKFNGLTKSGNFPGLSQIIYLNTSYNVNGRTLSNVTNPKNFEDASTKNYIDLYVSTLSVFDVGTHGILLNTSAITFTTTATALTLTNSSTIFNNPKSNINTLNNNTQVNITRLSAATVNFKYSVVTTVGATTGIMGLVVYDVTAANPAYTIAPTPATNTTEYLLRGSFTSIANHNDEFRVQITATGNIQFGAGYLSYGY